MASGLRMLLSRLVGIFRGPRLDDRLAEEIDAHLALLTDDYERGGMSPIDARHAARRAFGGVDQMRERHRDQRGLPVIETFVQDVRFAARLLVKDRWFTLAAAAALALGIGVNNTVFTLVNAGLIRSLPFEDPDRIVSIGTHDAREPFVPGPPGYGELSFPEYEDWRGMARTFVGLAAYADATMNLSDEERAPERFSGSYVSANTFGLLGRQPALGRDFRAEDDRPGAPPVVILSHGVWINRYGADAAVIGRAIRVNGVPSIVVGVMPVGFGFPMTADVWQPLALLPGILTQTRPARALSGVGRLADGVNLDQARADLNTIAARLSRDYPDTNSHIEATVTAYDERYVVPQMKLLFLALMGAVGFVLLIACANVANLLLARSATRAREIAVRVSLGATRWRIVRQLLVESVLLAALAGVAGLGLSVVGVRLFAATVDQTGKPYWLDFTMDESVFAFFAVVCLGTGILFGLAPALHVSKTNANQVLKEGGRGGSSGFRVRRWGSVLIVGELAMTLVLLAGAGFMMRAFVDLYTLDLGFDTSHLTKMTLYLPEQKYPTPGARAAFYQQLDERLAAVHGVASATIASNIPGGGAYASQIEIEGQPTSAGEKPPRVPGVLIGPRYFETLGLALRRGRLFTNADGTAGHESAIVNERFVATFFPGQDPIGRHIRVTRENPSEPLAWLTIVGVAPTVRQRSQRPPEPVVYLPHRREPRSTAVLVVNSEADLAAIVPLLREEVRALDADLPLFDISTVDQWLAFSRWPQRVFGTMFTIFAGLGVILSAVGLYAVIAYSVAQRTQEIGIRMALGARAPQVTWLVARRAVVQLGVGLLIGLPAAIGVGRALPFGSRDVTTLVPMTVLLLLVSLAACIVPARRATRLDPVVALRHD